MSTVIFDHGFDTFVWASEPTKTHGSVPYAILDVGAANYLWGSSLNGIPKGSTVQSATFSVFTAGAWGSGYELSCNTADSPWASGKATWNNRPGLAGTAVVVTHSPGAEGVEYAFDVTTMVQNHVAAQDFPGFYVRLTAGSGPVRIWQGDSDSPNTPLLVVTFTAPGEKPDGLSPNGVVGLSKPWIMGFPKSTVSVRVQADSSPTGFGSPDWESGSVDVSAPELDLSTTTFPGIGGLGSTTYFRGAAKKSGQDFGDYSDAIAATYRALPTLTITAPTDEYPYVTDPSPTFAWTFSDQTAWRAFVTTVGDGDKTIVWDSAKQSGDAHQVTMPANDPVTGKPILRDGQQYRVWVQCWDSYDRVAMPGAGEYQQEAQVFTFTSVAGVPPVDYLTAEQVTGGPPIVRLEWGRTAGSPDQWNIWRDGQILLSGIDPDSVLSSDSDGWAYRDYQVPSGPHTYVVTPVVNGSSGPLTPSATVTVIVETIWLLDDSRNLRVSIIGVDGLGVSIADQMQKIRPIGSRRTLKRTTALGFNEGTVTGFITGDSLRTADAYRDDLLAMAATPSQPVTLAYQNFAYPVLLDSVTALPRAEVAGLRGQLSVSIGILQQDEWTVSDTPQTPPSNPDPDVEYTYSTFANSHTLTIGDADITATVGTPVVVGFSDLHTTSKYYHGGGITRVLPNGVCGTRDIYFRVPSSLGSSSSIFILKNPDGDNPLDWRIRSAGVMDFHRFDGTHPVSNNIGWTKGVWNRARLSWLWSPDSSLGASMGQLSVWGELWQGLHVDNVQADDMIFDTYPSLSPVNIGQGSSAGGVDFETTRGWNSVLEPPPFGLPLPIPDIPPGNATEVGRTGDTDAIIRVYAGDAAPTDTIGLKRSTSSAMTSPSSVGSTATRGTYGYSAYYHDTGLTANTAYYYQLTVNGTLSGPVAKCRTLLAEGATGDLNFAGLTCQQTAPSSALVYSDIATWAGSTSVHFLLHHGDDGYPNDLVGTTGLGADPNATGIHQKWLAMAMTDVGRGPLATLATVLKTRSDHDTNQNSTLAPKGNNPNINDPTSLTNLLTWNAVVMDNDDVRTPSLSQGATWKVVRSGKFCIFKADTRGQERTDTWKSPAATDPGNSASTILGATQLAALKAEVDYAVAHSRIFILSCDPGFLGDATPDLDPDTGKIPVSESDKWCSYTHERDIVDNYIANAYEGASKSVDNAFIIHGDSHMVQNGLTTRGIRVFAVGQMDQNTHTVPAFQRAYSFTSVPNPNDSRQRQTWTQFVCDNTSDTTKVTITATPRNCTPREVGDTPAPITAGIVSWTATL